MSDLQLFVLHDIADATYATDVLAALRVQIDRQIPVTSDRPALELRGSLDAFPGAQELGALSLVLFVNPGRALTSDEQVAVHRFLAEHGTNNIRLVPVAPNSTRAVPPEPLDHLVSAHLHLPIDPAQAERLAVHVLNQMCLRLAGTGRKVFISYRMADGLAIATAVADGLHARGYHVWRDELQDRDGVPLITPGSPAQQTIERGIVDGAFVLLIDTPKAPESEWVQEEIDLAMRYMLPLLPIVVEDVIGTRTKLGGRFASLAAMQRERRLASRALTDANVPLMLDNVFFDELEGEMNTVLLEHLRSRRRLLHEAESRFKRMNFRWDPVDPQRLLFRAESSQDCSETPGLVFRLLVQCAPYDVLLDDSVSNLSSLFPRQVDHFQYGVLIHQTATYGPAKRRILQARGGHLMLLRYDELAVFGDMVPR